MGFAQCWQIQYQYPAACSQTENRACVHQHWHNGGVQGAE